MKKSCKILFIVLILMVLLLPIQVKAASFKFTVTPSKTNVKPAETVELTLAISDIDAGEYGINTVEGILQYDTTIFEEITSTSFQSLNNWSITYNNEDTEYKGKMLAVILQDGVKENQSIGKITFKVKPGVEYTKTTIKIKNIATNDGDAIINESDKQVTLEIGTKPQTSNNNNHQSTNNINVITNSSSQNANMSTGTLPQTGNINYVYIIIAVLLIIFTIFAYVQYKKKD